MLKQWKGREQRWTVGQGVDTYHNSQLEKLQRKTFTPLGEWTCDWEQTPGHTVNTIEAKGTGSTTSERKNRGTDSG